MILDRICNLHQYSGLIQNLAPALALMNTDDLLPIGEYPFDGGRIISVEGISNPMESKTFEVHQKYADVMVILQQDETVCYASVEEISAVQGYDVECDIAFYSNVLHEIELTVPAGFFYAMLPGEVHKPCVHLDVSKPYRKYVIKCRQHG